MSSDNYFLDIDPSLSGWGAVWFTHSEHIAEQFSYERLNDSNETQIIFNVEIHSDNIALIDYELFQDIQFYYDIQDLREAIPMLESSGFHGWQTLGSIWYEQYDDIAIFTNHLDNVVDYNYKRW